MYAKKLDPADIAKGISPYAFLSTSSPPAHSFRFKFYKSVKKSPTCYSTTCPRRGTYSPLEWSKYRIRGGFYGKGRDSDRGGDGIICADGRRDCYNQKFCNEDCFVKGWMESKPVPAGTFVKIKPSAEEEQQQQLPQPASNGKANAESEPSSATEEGSPTRKPAHIAEVDEENWLLLTETYGEDPR